MAFIAVCYQDGANLLLEEFDLFRGRIRKRRGGRQDRRQDKSSSPFESVLCGFMAESAHIFRPSRLQQSTENAAIFWRASCGRTNRTNLGRQLKSILLRDGSVVDW
jgi:hypothetical protein